MSTPPPTSTAAPLSPARTISPAQTTTPSYAPPTTRPPPPAPAPALNMHSDPKVAELQTMFPSVDPGVIEIVLESVSGSQDRAIEQLLSITDENFKAEEDVPGYRREAEVGHTPLLSSQIREETDESIGGKDHPSLPQSPSQA